MPKPEDDSEDEEDDTDAHENSDDSSFVKIVLDMVVTAMKEGHPADSVLMEIKGFKFAQNKVFKNAVEFCSTTCNFSLVILSIELRRLYQGYGAWNIGIFRRIRNHAICNFESKRYHESI